MPRSAQAHARINPITPIRLAAGDSFVVQPVRSAALNFTAPVSLTFTSAGTFDVSGTGTGNPIGVAFTAGDVFALNPSRHRSVFATLSNVISALQTPAVNGAGRAAVSNQVNAALTNMDRTLDTALTARTNHDRCEPADLRASGQAEFV